MPLPTDLLTPAELKTVSGLNLVARTVVDSFIAGRHRSTYLGSSVEFAQHRQYVRGDELRRMDWKVYAKTDRLFVKQFEEETHLRAMLVLDASGSMAFGSGGITKLDYARKLTAALAYLTLLQTDSVGLTVIDTAIRRQLPPRSSMRQLSAVLEELAAVEPRGETGLAPLLHDMVAQLKRRCLVVVVSDLFEPAEGLAQALAHFRHYRHEVLLMQVLDPAELAFPFDNFLEFRSLERDAHRLRLDARRIAPLYRQRFEAHSAAVQEACHRNHFHHVRFTTDQPFDMALAYYLLHRGGS